MVTTTFKTAGDARNITIRRPDYRAFRAIAVKVAALLEVDPESAMSAPEFEHVLQACTVEKLDDWLGEADYQEVIRLWDEVIAFCEFESFFAERQRRHFESSKAAMERQVDLQAAQINRLKSTGQLPESFSLESVMNAANPFGGILTSSQSSPTTTPAGTDGEPATSSAPTSGTSSETSPKRTAARKRSNA